MGSFKDDPEDRGFVDVDEVLMVLYPFRVIAGWDPERVHVDVHLDPDERGWVVFN